MMPAPDLRTVGRHLGRERYQRGHLTKVGKRTKRWRGEWRIYTRQPDGNEKLEHRSRILGLCAAMTRAEAQRELDRTIQAETSQTPLPSGDLTLAQFLNDVYLPIRLKRWTANTQSCMTGTINRHILPRLGNYALKDLNKAIIEKHLISLADSGSGYQLVDRVLVVLRSSLEEAVDNDYIGKNPARKAAPPKMNRKPDTRSLTENEVVTLFQSLAGRIRLMFRLLILCGLRVGELLALKRGDVTPVGLVVDESADRGRLKATKTERVRLVPLPVSLRTELEGWLATCPGDLLFPNRRGAVMRRENATDAVLMPARKASGIRDLDFQMCRRTFATLIRGDVKDTQEMLGHAKPAMTLQYYKMAIPARQLAAVEELDQRISGLSATIRHEFVVN